MEESAANDVRMKSIIYCFIAVLLLTSCGGTQSLPTTQLPKAVTSSPIISTKISTPTISPSTPSKTSLQTKDVTATQKTEPFLTKRNPSLKELNDYLQKNPINFYGLGDDSRFRAEDVNGDGKPDLVDRSSDDGRIYSVISYKDVNGDTEDDLVISDATGIIILLWNEDHYGELFRLETDTWSRADLTPNIVTYQDWTNDGVPEVVLDHNFASGGTGLMEYITNRTIIRCENITCENIWEGNIAYHADDYNTGGLEHYEVDMQPTVNKEGKLIIRAVDGGFNIYYSDSWEWTDFPDDLNILPSKLSIYTWNGKNFELTNQQVISLAAKVDFDASLAAKSSTGVNAKVIAKDNHTSGNSNDYCQLIINGENVGRHFGCRHNFTTVEWMDITGDDLEEVVVVTFSAGYPLSSYEENEDYLSDEECMHQRIIAYQSDGKNNVEIANVAGCVIQNDLYGVRLEDYDGDGVPEILAAPNVQDYDNDGIFEVTEGPEIKLNNRAYKWNGKKFVYWSDISLVGK
jgi:hypothetical protein